MEVDRKEEGGILYDRQKGWKGASIPALKHVLINIYDAVGNCFDTFEKIRRVTRNGDAA